LRHSFPSLFKKRGAGGEFFYGFKILIHIGSFV
jgi:hypothetical protein